MTNFSLLPPGVTPRFKLGNIVMTAEAFRRLSVEDVSAALARHARGDWGEVSTEDRDRNESALCEAGGFHSVYHDSNGVTFWIITEADRSVTTVLLPDDY